MVEEGGRGLGWPARALLGAYLALSAVDLVAEATGSAEVATVVMWFLMPVLAGFLVAIPRALDRLGALVGVALLFSWLGDTLGNWNMLTKIGFFLVAQLILIAAFRPYWRGSLLRRPGMVTGYGLAVVAVIGVVGFEAGPLFAPVVVYGLVLGLMGALSTGVNRLTAVGGLIFVVSDSLLAVNSFVSWFEIPAAGFWIMLSYLTAQLLIVLGVRTRP